MQTAKQQQIHKYQQLNLKNQNKKNELSKQLEQEQIHRNRDHMEGYQWGGERSRRGRGRLGEKVQGIRANNW